MSKKHAIRRVVWAPVLTLALLFSSGCLKSESPTGPGDAAEAPALPSLATMQFQPGFFSAEDLSDIDPGAVKSGKVSESDGVSAERTHFINAVVRVLFVQLLMYDALEEPIAAFALAVHSVPQPQEDGSYLWTYIFVDQQVEYSIFLYGTPLADRVAWRLEVSSNDPELVLDHFVWFEGESMNDDSQGYWQFYEPIGAMPVSLASTEGRRTARIDWFHDSPVENRLRVTVNGPGHPDEGDFLEFQETPASGQLNHFDASSDLASNITWYPDGSGSITVPDYNDGVQACWDHEGVNTVCP